MVHRVQQHPLGLHSGATAQASSSSATGCSRCRTIQTLRGFQKTIIAGNEIWSSPAYKNANFFTPLVTCVLEIGLVQLLPSSGQIPLGTAPTAHVSYRGFNRHGLWAEQCILRCTSCFARRRQCIRRYLGQKASTKKHIRKNSFRVHCNCCSSSSSAGTPAVAAVAADLLSVSASFFAASANVIAGATVDCAVFSTVSAARPGREVTCHVGRERDRPRPLLRSTQRWCIFADLPCRTPRVCMGTEIHAFPQAESHDQLL